VQTFAAAAAEEAAAAAGSTGALGLAGPVAVVVLAVVESAIVVANLVDDSQIPGQLQNDLAAAQSYSLTNLGAAIGSTNAGTSTAAQQELYAAFIELTLPDYPSSEPAPAPQAGDAGLQYQAWDHSHHTARLNGGWFVDTDANETPRLSLSIDTLDRTGRPWTLWRDGTQYLQVEMTNVGAANYPAPTLTNQVGLRGWDGNTDTVTVAGSGTTLNAALTPPVVFSWALGTANSAGAGNSKIYHYNAGANNWAATNGWEQVDGAAVSIGVGPDGQPWIVNQQGSIFRRTKGATGYVDGGWQVVPGVAGQVSLGADGSVWIVAVPTWPIAVAATCITTTPVRQMPQPMGGNKSTRARLPWP
jgi:hypothetical protein